MKSTNLIFKEFLHENKGTKTMAQVSQDTKIGKSMIGKYFCGEHSPSAYNFLLICRSLEVPSEKLIEFYNNIGK